MRTEIEQAIWAGDQEKLEELAPCRCCCHEHTFENCPARQWDGCRGQSSMTTAEERAWAAHYQKHHGLSETQFFGYGDEP